MLENTVVRTITYGFRNVRTLEGRDRRRVFWLYCFTVTSIWALILYLISLAFEKGSLAIAGPFALPVLISTNFLMFFLLFSACVRRLHDSGTSRRPAIIVFSAWVICGILLIPYSQWFELQTASAGSRWLDFALFALWAPPCLVATFGSYWMLYLLLRKGTAGPNRYGAQPPKSIAHGNRSQ